MEYFSGTRLQNWSNWLWRQFFNRPYRNRTKLLQNPDDAEKQRECWKWMYPEPLVVVSRDWIPPYYNLTPGYLYYLQDADGKRCVFHEKWLRRIP